MLVPTTDRDKRIAEVRRIYAEIATHQEAYEINCAGLDICVHPNVFSPKYFNDSEWFALEVAKLVGGGRFLDMGTGTGIIGLRAAIPDAQLGIVGALVTSVDCNPAAVETARENYKRHGIGARVLLGDLYAPLASDELYDNIFWNHPFNKGNNPNEPMLLRAGFDYNYKSLDQYIGEAAQHLAQDGRLLLGTGSIALIREIEDLAKGHGYELVLLAKNELAMGPRSENSNDFRIYWLKNNA